MTILLGFALISLGACIGVFVAGLLLSASRRDEETRDER